MGGYFWGCALNFFSQNWTNVARLVCKNYGDWRRTRRVMGAYLSVKLLTQYGMCGHQHTQKINDEI